MQIKDMATDELKSLIRETIAETMTEYLGVPDEGKKVKEEVKQTLLEIRQRRQAGMRGIPATEVAKRLGLE